MSEIETVTIEHGNSSVTMSGKDFAAATDPRTREMENVQCLRCDLTREELERGLPISIPQNDPEQ